MGFIDSMNTMHNDDYTVAFPLWLCTTDTGKGFEEKQSDCILRGWVGRRNVGTHLEHGFCRAASAS